MVILDMSNMSEESSFTNNKSLSCANCNAIKRRDNKEYALPRYMSGIMTTLMPHKSLLKM